VTIYRISQLAAHAGVPATTLRFYEREGLLPAARSSSGYRQYTDLDREKVQFIGAAKHLGLTLDRIRELLVVWDGGTCREVRDELRPLIAAQVVAAGERIDALALFRTRLAAALQHLADLPARSGRCDPGCSFLHGRPPAPVACSLDASAHLDRIDDWRRMLDGAEVVRLSDGGRAARVPADRADRLAALVVAEQRCCPFLSFRLTFDGATVELVAHAPADAGTVLSALFDGEAGPC
jgi:MerR family copper efflux transcriptional regulator